MGQTSKRDSQGNDAFYERMRPGDRYSMNLLFYGLPVTGKTEFVCYLAKILD